MVNLILLHGDGELVLKAFEPVLGDGHHGVISPRSVVVDDTVHAVEEESGGQEVT